jgi:hypothetical protein
VYLFAPVIDLEILPFNACLPSLDPYTVENGTMQRPVQLCVPFVGWVNTVTREEIVAVNRTTTWVVHQHSSRLILTISLLCSFLLKLYPCLLTAQPLIRPLSEAQHDDLVPEVISDVHNEVAKVVEERMQPITPLTQVIASNL